MIDAEPAPLTGERRELVPADELSGVLLRMRHAWAAMSPSERTTAEASRMRANYRRWALEYLYATGRKAPPIYAEM